jgi:hypothetical protein
MVAMWIRRFRIILSNTTFSIFFYWMRLGESLDLNMLRLKMFLSMSMGGDLTEVHIEALRRFSYVQGGNGEIG